MHRKVPYGMIYVLLFLSDDYLDGNLRQRQDPGYILDLGINLDNDSGTIAYTRKYNRLTTYRWAKNKNPPRPYCWAHVDMRSTMLGQSTENVTGLDLDPMGRDSRPPRVSAARRPCDSV